MSPQVTAAIIAAGTGVLTVIATVAVQIFGHHATSRDTKKAIEEQRGQLNTTLAAQREQLDTTLAAQRKQLKRTLAEQRTRTLNERFATAAGQLGSDKPSAVRLAGVYAMAGLADDWKQNRQTCVDVLCAYLRLPYDPDPGDDGALADRPAYRENREVRHTVIRVITAHLKYDAAAAVSWQDLNFDFTGAVFDGGDFTGARFSGGTADFRRAKFTGGTVSFDRAEFSDGLVRFDRAEFTGREVSFFSAGFSGSTVSFDRAEFTGGTVSFVGAMFTGGTVSFGGAGFSGDIAVSFNGAGFSGGKVSFVGARRSGGTADFDFGRIKFTPGTIDFPSWTDTPPPGVKLPGEAGAAEDGPSRSWPPRL